MKREFYDAAAVIECVWVYVSVWEGGWLPLPTRPQRYCDPRVTCYWNYEILKNDQTSFAANEQKWINYDMTYKAPCAQFSPVLTHKNVIFNYRKVKRSAIMNHSISKTTMSLNSYPPRQ